MGRQTKNAHWNSVAGVLRTVFPDSAEPEKLRVYRAWEAWPEVVGPANAIRAQPTRFRNGKLFVTVFHPALMQELQFVKERIRRRLKNNPYQQPSHSQWDSVHVYAMGEADIDVICSTEQGTVDGRLEIPNAADWFSQRLGVNLQGRYYQVEVITESDVPIDRIMINERPRKVRGR